jgi:hypothetical protein
MLILPHSLLRSLEVKRPISLQVQRLLLLEEVLQPVSSFSNNFVVHCTHILQLHRPLCIKMLEQLCLSQCSSQNSVRITMT